MNRRLALWTAFAIATLIATQASAQEVTIGYQGLPYKASGESNTGIQVSDGVLLHVGAGEEAGYDSNVFYSPSDSMTAAAIYRTTLFGELTNATRTGTVSKQLSFNARAGLVYRRYQFIDSLPVGVSQATADDYKNAWMPTAGLALTFGSGQVGFGLADTFARVEDAPYAAGQLPITRYNNQASVEGRWSPGGGRLTGTLRYTNMIDIFDTPQYDYANSVTNIFMLDGAWRWLPKTAIFINVQQGYIAYLNNDASLNNKFSSFPLRVNVGLRGLLTEKTSALLSVGYINAFTSQGPTTGGFWGSTYAELAFTIRPTLASRIVAGYRHDFFNSIIAAFSYDDTVYASYVQQIAGRLALDLSGRYVRRDYQGYIAGGVTIPRTDNLFMVGASLDYFVRNWIYAGVGYSLAANDSNVVQSVAVPALDYLKQQMFVRLGVTY